MSNLTRLASSFDPTLEGFLDEPLPPHHEFEPPADPRGELKTAADTIRFLLAGKATLTLESIATKASFTFRAEEARDNPHLFFVKVLTGPNNHTDFTYLGTLRRMLSVSGGRPEFQHGRKSGIDENAPSARAFAWFADHLARGSKPDQLRVLHEGKCGRCGRKLTVPSSIASGIGPECAGKL